MVLVPMMFLCGRPFARHPNSLVNDACQVGAIFVLRRCRNSNGDPVRGHVTFAV